MSSAAEGINLICSRTKPDITEQTKHVINSGGLSYDLFWETNTSISFLSILPSSIPTVTVIMVRNRMRMHTEMTKDLTWVAGGMYVGNFEKVFILSCYFYRRAGVSEQLPARCYDRLSP